MSSTQGMINPSCHKPLASQKVLFDSNLLVEKYDVKIRPKSSNKI